MNDEIERKNQEVLTIFVTVGTGQYSFTRMLNLVDQYLKVLLVPYVLNVQYGASTPYILADNQPGVSVSMFSMEQTRQLFREADLVFSHCGIGSIYNALQYSRPTVMIPRLHQYDECSDDHQLQIAKEMKKNPLLFVVDESVHPEKFVQFIDKVMPQPKDEVDLTNMVLAKSLQTELMKDEPGDILTVVSAGGHMTQALCVMKAVERFHMVTSVDINLDVGACSYHLVQDTQMNPLIHLKNIFAAIAIFRKVKPKALFSTGGPICLPFAVAAKLFRVQFIYLDTLSRVEDVSNTAQFLLKYKLASKVYVQWQHLTKRYPQLHYVGKTFHITGK